ncbi:MAG: response regulator [Mucilaginibacter sp.]|nr:response regulator [Mucilaginibacter sp.]
MAPNFKPKIVFIVDDDSVDNLIFKFLVRRFAQHLSIVEMDCGRRALGELQLIIEKEDHNLPDYLFLASQTPSMTCWEFLEEFEKLNLHKQKNVSIYILSSLLQDDVKKHEQDCLITGFINKPINPQHINKIFQLS